MKKKFYRQLTAAIAAVALLPAFPSVYADEGKSFFDDFNSYKEGSKPSAFAYVESDGTSVYVDALPSETDRSAAIDGNANDAFIQYSYTKSSPVTGKFYVSADVSFARINSSIMRWVLRDSDDKALNVLRIQNGSMTLFNGTVIGKYVEDKFYNVTVELDPETALVSVWVNQRLAARDIPLGSSAIKDLFYVRLQLSEMTSYSKVNIDNFKIENGAYIQETEEDNKNMQITAEEKMKNAQAFYENRTHAMIGGEKREIDAAPFQENGVYYVPLRAAANGFGAAVNYDAAANEVKISGAGVSTALSDGQTGTDTAEFDVPVKTVGGRMFVSVKTACDIFGKHVFEDKNNGLIIFSDEENFISWEDDLDLLNDIVAKFIYTDYSPEELIAMLKEQNPDNMHPRILVRPGTFEQFKQRLENDEFLQTIYAKIKADADACMDEAVEKYGIDMTADLNAARRILDKVASLAFMYNMTGEEKYAQRAWVELLVASYYSDWDEIHFLNVAEMSAAFAIGYDWLYGWLDDEQKQRLRTAMVKNGLERIMDDYEDNIRERTYYWSTVERPNNWTFVCNGALAMAAAAIADDGEEEICGKVLSNGLVNVRRALKLFAPNGSYGEGANYWNYATRYLSFYVKSLTTVFGSDLGYFDVPGMRNTVEFVESLNAPTGYYNFSDAGASTTVIRPAQMIFFAEMLNKPYLCANRISDILKGKYKGDWEDAIYYTESISSDEKMPLDKYSDIAEVAAMRSSYSDDALYVGFHNGDNDESHSHYDKGGFILDSMGERFFMDLGYDDYSLPNYRNCYRVRAEGHNTLVINPDANADQSPDGIAKIVKFESKAKGAYAIADLTNVYQQSAERVRRGVMMTEGRSAVVIRDELELKDSSEVWWFAHSDADDISISADKKTAVLTKGGQKLRAEILSDGEFEVMDAKPLPTSPTVVGQNENEFIRKLAIHYTGMKKGTITVGFSPYYDNHSFGEIKPLDEWSIADGEIEYETLDTISVDGEPLANFEKDEYSYTIEIPADRKDAPVVTADAQITDMREEGRIDGSVVVTPRANGKLVKPYVVTFKKAAFIGIPTYLTKLPVAHYDPSAVPQPDTAPDYAAFDEDLTTRWASEGRSYMLIDLGRAESIFGVGIAFWQGDKRKATLSVELSEDGNNFETVYSGTSCGKTEDYEIFEAYGKTARYVRLNFFGTNVGTWNSVLDIAVLKEGE